MPSPPIDFRQASQFKNEAAGAFKVATSVFGTGMASVTRGNQRTDPNVSVQGVDELYLDVSGLSLAQGRNFTLAEVQSGASIVMVGQSVVDRLFESWEDPVGQHVLVGSQRYHIAGILEARGTSFGRSPRECPQCGTVEIPPKRVDPRGLPRIQKGGRPPTDLP